MKSPTVPSRARPRSAGENDAFALWTGSRFAAGWLDFAVAASSYEPNQFGLDNALIHCDAVDVPFDDYLHEITVPLFYVGAAGGCGQIEAYTLSLTVSDDTSELIVQFYPPEATTLDFGHIDMLAAADAPTLVWQPVLEWIEEHSIPFEVAGGHRQD